MLLIESVISSKTSEPAMPAVKPNWGGNRFGAVFYILLCVEIGAFLLVAPWSLVWERNLWLSEAHWWGSLYLNPYFRGATSGLGLINLWLGISRAWNFRSLNSRMPEGD
ncbi:MAG: hypothetical protein HY648_05100 [Acidobacteria bacterium]|nr:hypothetical protein [Acidobacteriota bacterium]